VLCYSTYLSEKTNTLYRVIDMPFEGIVMKKKLKADKKDRKTLDKLIPVCSCCRKIRNDKDVWMDIDEDIKEQNESNYTYGICPDCAKELYPEYYDKNKDTGKLQSSD
jgi:hypothetical protein